MPYHPDKDGTINEYFEKKKQMWREWIVNYMATPLLTRKEYWEEIYRDLEQP